VNKEVEAMIDEDPKRVFSIKAEPADLFCVLNGLIEQGKSPMVRYFDEELGEFTCWQPLYRGGFPTRKPRA
tara:strand:- start:733 stop:945 length:213 start_codon:yes stop_codon:yes gene_type:complete